MVHRYRKKILYIESNTDGTVGGSFFSLLLLVEGLNKQKYYPVVLFYQENRLIPSFKNAGCDVFVFKKKMCLEIFKLFPWIKENSSKIIIRLFLFFPFIIFQKGFNYITTFILPAFKCWKFLKKEDISLIHLNNTVLRPQEWIFASLFTKAKIIAHERGINKEFSLQDLFWAHFLKAIICISDAVKNNLLKYGFFSEKLFRIYNGIDPDKFIATRTRNEIIKEFEINKHDQIIGIVGNVKYWKGQKTVVKSIKMVRKEFPKVKCFIIGGVSPENEDYFNNLQEIIIKENLIDNIIITGQRNDIPNLINSLDILIHASILPEPFGRVLIEGMAMKKPVIGCRGGAVTEIIVHGKTGLTFNPGDYKQLAENIIYLLKNTSTAQKMGKIGYKRLIQKFHINKTVEEIDTLYQKIIGYEN